MTNEELAIMIQNGERDKILELWEQVERLVKKQANNWDRAFEGRSGATFEDFVQAGFLGFMKAVERFTPDCGSSFTTWLCTCIKTPFTEVAGVRTAKQRNEPLRRTESLDEPLGNDEDSGLLCEMIKNPQAEALFNEIEQKELREAVETALQSLTDQQREIIRLRFWYGATLEEAGQKLGLSRSEAHMLERKALRILRHPTNSKKLKEFL